MANGSNAVLWISMARRAPSADLCVRFRQRDTPDELQMKTCQKIHEKHAFLTLKVEALNGQSHTSRTEGRPTSQSQTTIHLLLRRNLESPGIFKVKAQSPDTPCMGNMPVTLGQPPSITPTDPKTMPQGSQWSVKLNPQTLGFQPPLI